MTECLWKKLKNETRPVFLYGTGNGADKILDVFEYYDITPEGIFASDGFVRNRTFRDMPVCSYSDIVKNYGSDIVIVLAFGTTRDDVVKFIEEVDKRHTLYIPEVPLFCDELISELFTSDYYESEREKIEEAGKLFSGEDKLLYDEMIAFRISGKLEYLKRTTSFEAALERYVPPDVNNVLDLGAFRGDTAEAVINKVHSVKKIICVEPDTRSYRKLEEYAQGVSGSVELVLHNCAVGDYNGIMTFSSAGSRGSCTNVVNKRNVKYELPVCTIDNILNGERVQFIKLDIEGSEYEALKGSEALLKQMRPALAVSLYHRTEDIFKIPLYLNSILPNYSFRLSRSPSVPAWDLILWAVPAILSIPR